MGWKMYECVCRYVFVQHKYHIKRGCWTDNDLVKIGEGGEKNINDQDTVKFIKTGIHK